MSRMLQGAEFGAEVPGAETKAKTVEAKSNNGGSFPLDCGYDSDASLRPVSCTRSRYICSRGKYPHPSVVLADADFVCSPTKRRLRLGMYRADGGGGGRHVCARAPAPAPEGHRGEQSRGAPRRPVPVRLGQAAGGRCSLPWTLQGRMAWRHHAALEPFPWKVDSKPLVSGSTRLLSLPLTSKLAHKLILSRGTCKLRSCMRKCRHAVYLYCTV